MKAIMLIGEYLVGFLVLILVFFSVLLGLLISVIEVPRYLRIKFM